MTPLEFYIKRFGVCPTPEKDVPLHSKTQMIKFAQEYAAQQAAEFLDYMAEKLPFESYRGWGFHKTAPELYQEFLKQQKQ